jgi:Transcription termination factor nusG
MDLRPDAALYRGAGSSSLTSCGGAARLRAPGPEQTMSTQAGQACWFLIRTKRGKEFPAQEEIARFSEAVFVPVMLDQNPRGELARAPQPLFSNLVFALLDPETAEQSVRYCVGVRELLRDSRGPIKVPERVVELMMELCSGGVRRTRGSAELDNHPLVSGDQSDRSDVYHDIELLFKRPPVSAGDRMVALFRILSKAGASV